MPNQNRSATVQWNAKFQSVDDKTACERDQLVTGVLSASGDAGVQALQSHLATGLVEVSACSERPLRC